MSSLSFKKGKGQILWEIGLAPLLVLLPAYLLYLLLLYFFENGLAGTGDTVFIMLYIFFVIGSYIYIRNIVLSIRYLQKIGSFTMTIEEVAAYAQKKRSPLPKIAIFVPAYNEGYVIENTIKRLVKLDYPKDRYHIVVIVDERELDLTVEVHTRTIVDRLAAQFNPQLGASFIRLVQVPKWYSGEFLSDSQTFEKSTKGRALNYALQVAAQSPEWSDVDFIGIVDADGRLDINVLKEVAYIHLRTGARVLQGPVFQISNFNEVSIVGKIAALELAIHHLTELSHRLLLRKFQFLAGTNYFIFKKTLIACGGWNQHALVEDAEIALRLYAQKDTGFAWLSSAEIEQTPENFRVYSKQRERWSRGHLDLIAQVMASPLKSSDKFRFVSRIVVAQARFLFDVGFLFIAYAYMFLGLFPHLSTIFYVSSIVLFVISFLVYDIYGLMFRRLSKYQGKEISNFSMILQSLLFFLFSPVMVVVQAIPRIKAVYNYFFGSSRTQWYKTERTRELVTE